MIGPLVARLEYQLGDAAERGGRVTPTEVRMPLFLAMARERRAVAPWAVARIVERALASDGDDRAFLLGVARGDPLALEADPLALAAARMALDIIRSLPPVP